MRLATKITAVLLTGVFLCVVFAEYVMLQHENVQMERDSRHDAQQLCGTIAQIVEELWQSSPFVAVNCAALPETLLESELFGHAKGAFTDARDARAGLFMQADGGTLFLDELGDFPLPMQAKLLRALEQQQLRPVGGDRDISFDVRILSATNRDLDAAIEENRFREDLFFRINVLQIELPPLRARGSDILVLASSGSGRAADRARGARWLRLWGILTPVGHNPPGQSSFTFLSA